MAGMTLLPALSGRYPDRADAVAVNGEATSYERLAASAGALAARIAGAPAVAVTARPALSTVVAVVAGLLAGVPVVPVPADAGPLERDHLLADSGAVPLADDDLDVTGAGDAGGAGGAEPPGE